MEEKTTRIEKTLKRNRFNLFDSAYACVCFIILQIISTLLIRIFKNQIYSYQSLYFIAQFVVEAVFFIATIIVSSSRNVDFVKSTTYNKKLDYRTALLAIAISAICIVGFSSLTNVFVYSLEKLGYSSSLGSISIPNFGYYILYVFLLCIVPALFEETLFRGTILNGMREKGKIYAVMMSALIFMLMHGGPDQTIHQFILGVILGFVLVYSGSIWATVLIHFLNNFYSVTAIYIIGLSAQAETEAVETATETLPSWGSLALTLVIGIAVASISAYLIYLCIKGMIAVRKSVEKKDKEKFLELLDKKELSEKELVWLKKYKNAKDEYENCELCENHENETLKIFENEQTIIAKNSETQEIKINLKSVERKKKKSVNSGYVGLLALSLAYLIFEWILTLVSGFLG